MNLADFPKDPELWKTAWDELAGVTAAAPHGIELESISDDELVLRMPITDASRQPYGLFHGGVSLLLAESAASFHSCWGIDLREAAPVGIEINGSHMNSARDGWVRATARIVKRGRRLVVHEVDIVHEETDKLMSRCRVTNLIVPHESVIKSRDEG